MTQDHKFELIKGDLVITINIMCFDNRIDLLIGQLEAQPIECICQ